MLLLAWDAAADQLLSDRDACHAALLCRVSDTAVFLAMVRSSCVRSARAEHQVAGAALTLAGIDGLSLCAIARLRFLLGLAHRGAGNSAAGKRDAGPVLGAASVHGQLGLVLHSADSRAFCRALLRSSAHEH